MRCSKNRMFFSKKSAVILAAKLALILPTALFSTWGFCRSEPKFSSQLKNWGLVNTQAQSHIQATDAWQIEEGKSEIVVAVIDTGIDPKNKLLAQNLWHNTKENHPETYGWDFVTNTPNPSDVHGHGTHVAGIIGAISDPESGVSGVAHHVSIMPIKYYSEGNSGAANLKNTIRAINYAIDHGARIINYSGGGPEFSEEEFQAIKRAESKGILFVAAAGNEHQNTDKRENYYFPSAYRLYQVDNIISVAATDMRNELLPSSNWGKKSVDVAAPGENILSTLPEGRFGYMTGTSQATAFVSGLAALLLSQDPSLTPQQLKSLIISSVDHFKNLQEKLLSGGRVNAYHALLSLQHKSHPDQYPEKRRSISTHLIAQHPHTLQNSISQSSISQSNLGQAPFLLQ